MRSSMLQPKLLHSRNSLVGHSILINGSTQNKLKSIIYWNDNRFTYLIEGSRFGTWKVSRLNWALLALNLTEAPRPAEGFIWYHSQVYGCVKNVKFFNSEHFILNFPFRWKTLSNSLKQRGREDWKHWEGCMMSTNLWRETLIKWESL